MSMTTFEGSPHADFAPGAQAAPVCEASAGFVSFISGSASNVAEKAKKAREGKRSFTPHKSSRTPALFQQRRPKRPPPNLTGA